jgi:DNA-binding GntR family transcriptional regulator
MSASATLAETVADELRHAIVNGHRPSGERLTEITLAREMNVSQNTIRDALRLLEQDGWVVKHARRGVYVRTFTAGEAAEVYTLLAAVGRVALDYGFETRTKTYINELRHLLTKARRAGHRDDYQAATEAMFAFHATISGRAHKPLTAELLSRLYNYARLLEAIHQTRVPPNVETLDAQLELYDVLLKRIEDGDRSGAHDALDRIMDTYRAMVIESLQVTD